MPIFRVFEHAKLRIGQLNHDKIEFTQGHYNDLVKFNDIYGNKYLTIRRREICFRSYVGVIQIGDLAIEILPKADNVREDKYKWQNALIYVVI